MPEAKQDRLAFDRDSIRAVDGNSGHLHVSQTPISKANICPYYGNEIADFEAMGLDPTKTYKLLRDPAELEKAAKSFDGKPLLIKHRPQTAEDHDHDVVVGSVSNPVWDAPYLKADLSVWDGDAIKAIESNAQRQLSCGYFYQADMTPGTYEGERYDGRMTNIAGNHVALVDEGRAGPDVFVGDSKPNPQPKQENVEMASKPAVLSRRALFASGAIRSYLVPKLAADAKLDLNPILKNVTNANWKTSKAKIKTALDKAVVGKLAADADLEDVMDLLDKLDDADINVEDPALAATGEDEDVDAMDADADEMGRLKAHLKSKGMSDDDINAACAAMKAEGEDEAPEMKPEDKPAPVPMKPEVTKAAMDAAIAKARAEAETATIARLNGIREAERIVRPYVGEIAVAMDSAASVLKFALDSLNVDVEGVHPSAYAAILNAQPKPGDAKAAPKSRVAQDAAAVKDFDARYPRRSALKQH